MSKFYLPQKNFLTILLWFLFLGNVVGQNLTQTVRGMVSDVKHQPLEGVTIYLPKVEKGATTDEFGKFRLDEIPVGRYQMRVSYVGFETLVLAELMVQSGKEEVLDIFLKKVNSELQEIVVKSNVRDLQRGALVPEILTIEETLRMPSTFYDPARLTFTYAGVANTNDQANNMMIRGNTPNSMSWRLDGVEIVNPNHLTGAGTFADRTTQNGGGVNILSAQMLGTSTFYKSAFPTSYGNVLSGIMDMKLRKGNNETREFTGQIGLIGIDIAAEGPLNKDKGSSFLANYRYSTLGLLSAMGVDLGDEAITFQDLSLHLNFPLKSGGDFGFFAIGGSSSNIFEGPRNDSLRVFEKDKFDIDYTSVMAAVGFNLYKPLTSNVLWKNTVVYSASEYERLEDEIFFVNDEVVTAFNESDNLSQSKLSILSSIQYQISDENELSAGIQVTNQNDDFSYNQISNNDFPNAKIEGTRIQPFVTYQQSFKKIDLRVGLRNNYFTFNKTNSIEPQLGMDIHLSAQQKIGLAYGLNSQLQLSQVYANNQDLEATKAHYFSMAYQNRIKDRVKLKLEGYYQFLFDVPVSATQSNSFSTLNLLNELVSDTLVNDGTGKNYGIEISTQQYFSNNVFWVVNLSLYDSKYKGSDGIERDTRFNGNYIVNFTGGKEFLWSKKEKEKDLVLGINARIAFLGGFKATPIDLTASMNADETIFNLEEAFSVRKKNYFRPDLRIYFTRNKKKYSSTLALDIQNVSNQKNVSFQYFDTFKKEIVQNYQLGIIPILNYRIEF